MYLFIMLVRNRFLLNIPCFISDNYLLVSVSLVLIYFVIAFSVNLFLHRIHSISFALVLAL